MQATVSPELFQKLSAQLQGKLPFSITSEQVSLLSPPKGVADDTTKLLVKNPGGVPGAVVFCSSPAAPGMVARSMTRAADAKHALGQSLGSVILDPLAQFTMDGLTCAALPYCRPLSNFKLVSFLQRRRLRREISRWLAEATRGTAQAPDPAETKESFQKPLEHLSRLEAVSSDLRAASSEALERLRSGDWAPRFVLMHGDFHRDNFLLSPSGDVVVIDWAGSLVKGYAIFDLVRLAQSLKFSPPALFRQVSVHCDILSCPVEDSQFYLAAALGYLEMHREHFPLEQYVMLAESCLSTLAACLRT